MPPSVKLIRVFERLHDPTDALVHVMDHAVVGVNVAALEVKYIVLDGLCQGVVIPRLPRPMRRGVMHAQEKGFAFVLRHALDKVN